MATQRLTVTKETSRIVKAATRFVERLLPEKCPCGINEGWLDPCSSCADTGQLWDEGLVEVVRKAILDFDRSGSPYPSKDGLARAVLSALTQEVGT